jgi:hypothetical protein
MRTPHLTEPLALARFRQVLVSRVDARQQAAVFVTANKLFQRQDENAAARDLQIVREFFHPIKKEIAEVKLQS